MEMKRHGFLIILCLGIISLLSSCSTSNNVYSYELTLKNASDKDILFVTVITGTKTNMFGFLGSGKPRQGKRKGAIAAGCPISFNEETKITWEENEIKHEYDLKLKDFYSIRKQIAGFIFIYQGNGKWTIATKTKSN